MLRRLFAIFVATLFTGPAVAKNVVIRWHGQSFFEVHSTKGTVIAIDPHGLEAYGRREVNADAVLVSHFHIDHYSEENISNARMTKWIFGLQNKLKLAGNRKNDEFNEIDEKIKDVHIYSVASYHDNSEGMIRGKNTIFVLEVDGLRIVHLGDLAHPLSEGQLKKIGVGKVDVLMVPVGGVYALNGAEAKKVVEQIKPRRYVIPMHYGTKIYNYLLKEDEFLEDQDEKRIKRLKGNELEIDPDEAPRPAPFITLLHYDPDEKKEPAKDKK